MHLAEQVLRDAQNYYGRPMSSTYLVSKIVQHKDNPKYEDIAQKIYKKALEHEEIISHSGIKTIDRILSEGTATLKSIIKTSKVLGCNITDIMVKI